MQWQFAVGIQFFLQPVEVSVNQFQLALADEDGTNCFKIPSGYLRREASMKIGAQTLCKATFKVREYMTQGYLKLSLPKIWHWTVSQAEESCRQVQAS